LLLTHPPTALSGFAALGAFALGGDKGEVKKRLAAAAAVACLAAVLACLWPYYSFLELIGSRGELYNYGNRWMYGLGRPAGLIEAARQVLAPNWPALLGLPLLMFRLRRKRLDPLAITFAVLAGLYAWGALSGRWALGRVIPGMVLMLHLALALWAVDLEKSVSGGKGPRLPSLLAALALGAVLVFSALGFTGAVKGYLPGASTSYYKGFSVLDDYIGDYDVVVADRRSSNALPAFAGKVVAAGSREVPFVFIEDQQERGLDIERFFQPMAREEFRRKVIARYGARYLLINRASLRFAPDALNRLWSLGETVYSSDDLILIDLKG
jgi:hypothetical protein